MFRKASKFKYYKGPCNRSEKIPLTKNTLLYGSNVPVRQYILLIYGLCYRFKYADVKLEAELEWAEDWDQEETTVNHSKQFINDNNKRVHTQGIEFKWR